MAADELERGPFGQRLSLLVHRFPRVVASTLDWELERGFHLRVLAESMFELNLRRTGATDTPLPLFGEPAQVDKLLVWQKSPKDGDWLTFSNLLKSGQPWQAALILCPSAQRGSSLSSYFSLRTHTVGAPCPVVEVFQETPTATFFTVEKNLFALGRVGRRLQRYAGMRRLLPW